MSISTGAVLLIVGADSALNWVLENHEAPCGEGVSARACPPIKLQRALAAEGVVTVWAAGNDGGDASASLTNPPGQDPTGGILSVASYYDQDTGTRDGVVSEYSSRGAQSDPVDLAGPLGPGREHHLGLPAVPADLRHRAGPAERPGDLDIGTFNTISGTSMAAPHIAGIVAQLFQADPSATPAEIEAALKGSTCQFSDGASYTSVAGYSTSYDKGTGPVDVVAAVRALTGA